MTRDDDVPLPPEPIDPEPPESPTPPDPGASSRPVTVAEILAGVPWALPGGSGAEATGAARVYAAARRVHVADLSVGGAPDQPRFRRLGDGFDPRGRHVGCDGEPDGAGGMRGGCGVPPGQSCKHPRGRFVSGFVHPSRLAAERRLFGVDLTDTTASV